MIRIEPQPADINGVVQALARAIAESRVVRNGIARCPFCGRGFGAHGRGEARIDHQRAMRIHLMNVQSCRREMLEEGKVPPDSRKSEPTLVVNREAGEHKSASWVHRAGHDSNYAGE